MIQDVKWAINFAREYRQQNQTADALRLLADAVLELRAESRVLRELIEPVRVAIKEST